MELGAECVTADGCAFPCTELATWVTGDGEVIDASGGSAAIWVFYDCVQITATVGDASGSGMACGNIADYHWVAIEPPEATIPVRKPSTLLAASAISSCTVS